MIFFVKFKSRVKFFKYCTRESELTGCCYRRHGVHRGKAFQNGRKSLYESGMTRIESLAIIESLDNGILLREDPNL